ncbi:MAG: Lrp/AsnC family transcriptional regulator [Steroidobacteraceae bacterium]|jgi:Lrp/AsnC family leucine-responsive transcriptional regulator|nr:Lrp/AsnC family transcriptional regulator [Gammaproteobacteria bacterium]
MPIDKMDRRILRELQLNGRVANAELSSKVGLSESACLRRVRRLEEERYIERYTAKLNLSKLGWGMSLMVIITLKAQTDRDLRAFERAVSAVPEITECFLTTGAGDYILRVLARDASDIERLHSTVLTQLPGVARVESSFVLREIVSAGSPPIERISPPA